MMMMMMIFAPSQPSALTSGLEAGLDGNIAAGLCSCAEFSLASLTRGCHVDLHLCFEAHLFPAHTSNSLFIYFSVFINI